MQGRRPPTETCYLCGREYGRASIAIHQKQCERLWQQQESKKPAHERRALPPKPKTVAKADIVRANLARGGDGTLLTVSDERDAKNLAAADHFNSHALVQCEHCFRTFLPERLVIHQKVCTAQKPAKSVQQSKRKTVDTGRPNGTIAQPQKERVDAYRTFAGGGGAQRQQQQQKQKEQGTRPVVTSSSTPSIQLSPPDDAEMSCLSPNPHRHTPRSLQSSIAQARARAKAHKKGSPKLDHGASSQREVAVDVSASAREGKRVQHGGVGTVTRTSYDRGAVARLLSAMKRRAASMEAELAELRSNIAELEQVLER